MRNIEYPTVCNKDIYLSRGIVAFLEETRRGQTLMRFSP
jgi:hypothetical protein